MTTCASYVVVATIGIKLSERKVFDKKREENIRDFATHRFCTLAMALAHAGGLDSFGIDEKGQVSLSVVEITPCSVRIRQFRNC